MAQMYLLITLRLLLFLFCIGMSDCFGFENKNKFVLKVSKTYEEHIRKILEEYNFEYLNQITPDLFYIQYNDRGEGVNILEILSERYKNEIVSWEPVRIYNNTIETAQTTYILKENSTSKTNDEKEAERSLLPNQTCKCITIAISGIGENNDLANMESYIRNSLEIGSAESGVNVNNLHETTVVKDSGIVETKGADVKTGRPLCTAEIINNATKAVLQIYDVLFQEGRLELQTVNRTISGIMTRAHVYILDETDIFVNDWSTTKPFQSLDVSNQEAIEYGAIKGRRGLGTIFLVPAGSPGNDLSNNHYTITVGSVKRNEGLYFNVDASVIISGSSEQVNLTQCSALTTSFKNECISSDSCLSASIAQVAVDIALVLEDNRNLSIRDIRHCLVQASEQQRVKDLFDFKTNGAGHSFNEKLGFGLLNSPKFTKLCKTKKPVSDLLTVTLDSQLNKSYHDTTHDVNYFYNCTSNVDDDDCITSVEQIFVSVKLNKHTEQLTIAVISPARTESVLIKEVKPDFTTGIFVTNHFWDEKPIGMWTVKIKAAGFSDLIEMAEISITINGMHRPNTVSVSKMLQSSAAVVVLLTVTALLFFLI